MSKFKSLSYFFRICFFCFSLYYLHFDFSPFYFTLKNERKLKKIKTYFAEMYSNLTIYREKYTKDTKQREAIRYFENGDSYLGTFYRGNFNQGSYFKKNDKLELDFNRFEELIKNITGDINLSKMSIDNYAYLLFDGKFDNGLF